MYIHTATIKAAHIVFYHGSIWRRFADNVCVTVEIVNCPALISRVPFYGSAENINGSSAVIYSTAWTYCTAVSCNTGFIIPDFTAVHCKYTRWCFYKNSRTVSCNIIADHSVFQYELSAFNNHGTAAVGIIAVISSRKAFRDLTARHYYRTAFHGNTAACYWGCTCYCADCFSHSIMIIADGNNLFIINYLQSSSVGNGWCSAAFKCMTVQVKLYIKTWVNSYGFNVIVNKSDLTFFLLRQGNSIQRIGNRCIFCTVVHRNYLSDTAVAQCVGIWSAERTQLYDFRIDCRCSLIDPTQSLILVTRAEHFRCFIKIKIGTSVACVIINKRIITAWSFISEELAALKTNIGTAGFNIYTAAVGAGCIFGNYCVVAYYSIRSMVVIEKTSAWDFRIVTLYQSSGDSELRHNIIYVIFTWNTNSSTVVSRVIDNTSSAQFNKGSVICIGTISVYADTAAAIVVASVITDLRSGEFKVGIWAVIIPIYTASVAVYRLVACNLSGAKLKISINIVYAASVAAGLITTDLRTFIYYYLVTAVPYPEASAIAAWLIVFNNRIFQVKCSLVKARAVNATAFSEYIIIMKMAAVHCNGTFSTVSDKIVSSVLSAEIIMNIKIFKCYIIIKTAVTSRAICSCIVIGLAVFYQLGSGNIICRGIEYSEAAII